MKSPALVLFLGQFKEAAAEGAVVELKLRLLAGKVPALQKYAHQKKLEDIEDDLAVRFGEALSAADKDTLQLCRQLRNKVLHTDFRAARKKLNELGVVTETGGVVKIELPVVTIAEATRKIEAAKAGKEGTTVAQTSSTADAGVYAWFLEAGYAGDFQKAADAFRRAGAIVDRLAEAPPARPER